MKYFIGLAVLLPFLIGVDILRGFAIMWLWLWFVVPLGVVKIGIAHSIGISCLIGMFRTAKEKKEDQNPIEYLKDVLIAAVLTPVMALVVGWFIQRFFL